MSDCVVLRLVSSPPFPSSSTLDSNKILKQQHDLSQCVRLHDWVRRCACRPITFPWPPLPHHTKYTVHSIGRLIFIIVHRDVYRVGVTRVRHVVVGFLIRPISTWCGMCLLRVIGLDRITVGLWEIWSTPFFVLRTSYSSASFYTLHWSRGRDRMQCQVMERDAYLLK